LPSNLLRHAGNQKSDAGGRMSTALAAPAHHYPTFDRRKEGSLPLCEML